MKMADDEILARWIDESPLHVSQFGRRQFLKNRDFVAFNEELGDGFAKREVVYYDGERIVLWSLATREARYVPLIIVASRDATMDFQMGTGRQVSGEIHITKFARLLRSAMDNDEDFRISESEFVNHFIENNSKDKGSR